MYTNLNESGFCKIFVFKSDFPNLLQIVTLTSIHCNPMKLSPEITLLKLVNPILCVVSLSLQDLN